MAEGNATIAALRAVSSAAPTGPSGPVALVYPWMNTPGRELVMPVRPPAPPRNPKARLPPEPGLPPPPGRPIIQPPLPPGAGGGRRGEAPGRGGDGGGWSYIGDWGSDVPPYAVIDPGYVPPSEPAPPSEPPVEPRPEPPGRRDADQFEILPLMQYIQPVPFAEAGPVEPRSAELPPVAPVAAVELAPDPVPYMPGIFAEEAPEPVAPVVRKSEETVQPQMSVIEMLQQMVPPPADSAPPPVQTPASDLELLDFIQPAPAEDAPVQAAPPARKAPQPVQPEIDPMLLRYLMMSGFSGMAEL